MHDPRRGAQESDAAHQRAAHDGTYRSEGDQPEILVVRFCTTKPLGLVCFTPKHLGAWQDTAYPFRRELFGTVTPLAMTGLDLTLRRRITSVPTITSQQPVTPTINPESEQPDQQLTAAAVAPSIASTAESDL